MFRQRVNPFVHRVAVVAFGTACLWSCGGNDRELPSVEPPAAASDSAPWLVDVTTENGLPAPTGDYPAGSFSMPEIMGAGVALFDFDGDGDLDLLQLRFPPPGQGAAGAANRLFAQQDDGRFLDVTEASGAGDSGYAQAVAVGDVDDDGDLDLFLANHGDDVLLLNTGEGRFEDGTQQAGLASAGWSSAATFCDDDGDGDLDLFVTRYLEYGSGSRCFDNSGRPDYCNPAAFPGAADSLYRNDGRGHFSEVSEQLGLRSASAGASKGLGVICTDLSGDGRPDYFVANDGQMNQLWVVQADGRFADEAILRGLAVNRHGSPQASMGVCVGDVDGDADLDLLATHIERETNTLYLNDGSGHFGDATIDALPGAVDQPLTGFGCALNDVEHDGDLDLAVVNGRVYRGRPRAAAGLGPFWNAFAEPNQMWLNAGPGLFSPATVGGDFGVTLEVSRGMAGGDLDGDGDQDWVVSNNDGSLRMWRNEAPREGMHWVRVRAVHGRHDALGAQVAVSAGERRWRSAVLLGNGYQSSSDPAVHFGLGAIDAIDTIEVTWTDGSVERFDGDAVDRIYVLRRGEGSSE